MAGVAPHVDRFGAAGIDRRQSVVDHAQHPVHRARHVLHGIVVGREIVAGQGLAFLADVAIRTPHTERAGEPSHHGAQPLGRKVRRQDLQILAPLRPRPLLGPSRRRRCERRYCEDREPADRGSEGTARFLQAPASCSISIAEMPAASGPRSRPVAAMYGAPANRSRQPARRDRRMARRERRPRRGRRHGRPRAVWLGRPPGLC